MVLQAAFSGESTLGTEFHAPFPGESSLDSFHAAFAHDTTLIGELHAAVAGESTLFTGEFAKYWVDTLASVAKWTESGGETALVVPNPIPKLLIGAIDATELAQDITIDESWNGVAQLSFQLRPPCDEHGLVQLPNELVPPGYGAWAGLVRRHNFSTTTLMQVQTDTAGDRWESPRFLPTEPHLSESGELQWGGEDLSGLLQQEHQWMPSIQIEAGQHVMAQTALRQTAAAYGIPNVRCNWQDYLIRELHRSGGTPLGWCDKLAHTMHAGRRLEGGPDADTLVYEQYMVDSLHNWTFVDQVNIWKVEGPGQLPRPKNQFTVARLDPSAGILKEHELTGGECLIRQKIALDKPSRFVQVEMVKMINGEPKNWVFKDINGDPVPTSSAGIAASSIPIASFEFDYVPAIGNFKWTPHYELVARGNGVQPAFSQSFSKTWPLPGHLSPTQAFDGINPEWTILESALIADSATAERSAKAAEAESVRKFWGCTFMTPYLNPRMRPGDRIRVQDYQTRQSGTVWFVDHLQKKWNRAGGTWEMRMECSRGV